MGIRSFQKSLMVVTDSAFDIESALDALVGDGTISVWRASASACVRTKAGELVSECDLSDLATDPSEDDCIRAERFWHGAIEGDGSMSETLLSVMRMDDEKREAYRKRYKTMERYVQEMSALHADAILLPDGTFASNDGMRGCNQLHDWNVGFFDRFIRPLIDGSPDGSSLAVRMFEYAT